MNVKINVIPPETSTTKRYGIDITDYIGVGKKNAVSRKKLSEMTGVSDRNVRWLITKARQSGAAICADEVNGGYYIADTDEEKEKLMNTYLTYVKDMLKTYNALKKTPLEGQLYLWGLNGMVSAE